MKCRIWWPNDLTASTKPPSSANLLFGWLVSTSSSSIDVVVAFSSNYSSFPQSALQGILCDINGKMPMLLQDKVMFRLLGECATYPLKNERMLKDGRVGDNEREDVIREHCGGRSCGCYVIDGLVEQCWHATVGSSIWIRLFYDFHEQYGRKVRWVPQLHHIHWKGNIISQCDVHVILYETPIYGGHHFSLNFQNSSEQQEAAIKKPSWVDELNSKRSVHDLNMIILAINSAAAAKMVLERQVGSKQSHPSFSIICMCFTFLWQVFAVFMASVSTLCYVILQLVHGFSSFRSIEWAHVAFATVFRTTWTNIQIRCCQILYWPIFLRGNGFRLQSCVEYAEKAALHRHSMWSSLVVDLLLGNLIGLTLFFKAESACSHILTFANDVTNELLRSGCVWLMGVPAGFKLNTELAGVLGMISLNAIQIWSTLWFFGSFLFIYFIKGLALLGILFGATIPAALIMDMIVIGTLHVLTLHHTISLFYSRQIQALAALWRLFRGRKWNPLRQRLDSYDYTVKQHIVGSLMFTPLLLLLPTTSVFYIFFTILNTSITFVRIIIEVIISLIHGLPYIEVFLWLVRRHRFPCGIWFEILSCPDDSSDFLCLDKMSSSLNSQQNKDSVKMRSGTLVSVLHSNFLTIGQLILPHCKKIFCGVSGFLTTSAYGALTGERTPSTLGTGLPSILPWMLLPSREYWCLCYNSILE